MGVEQLNQMLSGGIFAIMLVFARVGAAMINLPGFGDTSLSPVVRLYLALAFAVVITPVVRNSLPPTPNDASGLLFLLGTETVIGLFIGTIGRLLLASLEMAGQLIGQQTGLSTAQIFNPQLAAPGSLPGSLLSVLAVLLLFVTDLHHLVLRGLVSSYELFPVGGELPMGDFADVIAHVVSNSFALGVQLAAPFVIVTLLMMVALGLIARMMPQVQVFFVAQPLQLALGFAIFAIVLPALLLIWMGAFQSSFIGLLSPGGGG